MIRAWRHPGAGAASLLPLISCELPEPADAAGPDAAALGADQVVVRVEASVVGAPELGQRVAVTPGGAAVGTVQRTGEAAAHLLGKRVLVAPDQGCGECDVCRRAGVVVCPAGGRLGRDSDGTLATVVTARARWVCVLDRELAGVPGVDGPAAALIAREAAWAYALFARGGVAPGEPVFIVGAGPGAGPGAGMGADASGGVVARFLCQIAVSGGVRPMVLVAEGTGAWVESLGGVPVPVPARSAADPAAVTAAAERAAQSGGHGKRPWYVFETSATDRGRAQALCLAGPGVRLVALASSAVSPAAVPDAAPHARPAPPAALASRALLDAVLDRDGAVLGVAGAHPDLLPEVAALVVRGDLDVVAAAELVAVDALAPEHAERVASAQSPMALVALIPGDPI